MDRDAELSMNHAHAKWMLSRMVVAGLVIMLVLFTAVTVCDILDTREATRQQELKTQQAHEEAMRAMWEHTTKP